jgi:hypothetical protein
MPYRADRCEHGVLLAEYCEDCWQEACDFDGDEDPGVAHAEQGKGAR